MPHPVRFVETPNRQIVVADVQPQLMINEIQASRMRKRLSGVLGETPVLLRCRVGGSLMLNGHPNLQRYAADPMVDALPVVWIDPDPPLTNAA